MDIYKVRESLKHGGNIYSMPFKVAFYARVSTEKMEQASSLENQVNFFNDYIKGNPDWIYVDGYIDEGISGTSTKKRDNFNRMIDDARRGKFDIIVTKEISRFSRNTLDSIMYTQELLKLGVIVIFLNDGINTIDPDSEFRLVVMAGVAQDEVRKLSERLKFGFKQSIKNGRVLGNNRMYGYDKNDCQLTINETQAEVVRTIFNLYANEGLGFRKIAQYVSDNLGARSYNGNEFNFSTVKNILLNPKYKGYYCGNKTRSIDYREHISEAIDQSEWVVYKDDSIPAIVSEELWDRANAILQNRSKGNAAGITYHNKYPYSGKIICAEHGTSFYRAVNKSKKGNTELWHCKEYKYRGVKGCSAPNIRTSEVDAIMAEVFKTVIADRDSYVQQVMSLIQSAGDDKDYAAELQRMYKEMEIIDAKKDKLLELSIEGALSVPEFKARNSRLNEQSEQLQERIDTLLLDQETSQNTVENMEKIKAALDEELSFEHGVNSKLVTSLLDKIVVHNSGERTKVKLQIYLKVGQILPFEFDRRNSPLCCNPS